MSLTQIILSSGSTITAIPDLSNLTKSQIAWCQKWIVALRNGDQYPQINDALKTDGGFCCLGVATDLAVKEGFGDWMSPSRGGECYTYHPKVGEYRDRSNTGLPIQLQNLYGMRSNSGIQILEVDAILSIETKRTLIGLNDNDLATFPEIANILEIALGGGLNPLALLR